MNPAVLTAAHRSLAFGTKVKVTNRNNGRTVVVRINDRGPFIRGRVLETDGRPVPNTLVEIRVGGEKLKKTATMSPAFSIMNVRIRNHLR